MILVIDGYNLLKQIFYKQKDVLHEQREELIKQLGCYFEKKKDDIALIIIVFDAGPYLYATRNVYNSVVEIYSGQRSTADDWIAKFVEKNKHKSLLLVTMDKELINRCENFGADTMSVNEFYSILQDALLENGIEDVHQKKVPKEIKKLEKEDVWGYDDKKSSINSEALDFLMQQEDFHHEKKESLEDKYCGRKKGNSHKLSKKERKKQAKIKKLL